MNYFDNLLPDDLYHTYIVNTNLEDTSSLLLRFLEDKGHILPASPDVIHQKYDSFTMDDSEFVKDWASNKGITSNKKIFILETSFINREAEQSLLKLLEEPGERTHFFIIVPHSTVLSSTIISRAHIINIEKNTSTTTSNNGNDAKGFLNLKPADRITYIADIIKRNEDSEGSGSLRHEATNLINQIESIMHEKLKSSADKKNLLFILEELQKARGYLGSAGSSVKMILEHVALII